MDVYNCLNQILSTIYTILIIVISSISTPEISEYVKNFLSSNINKLIVVAVVVYLAFNNFVLGVVLTMGLYLVIEGDNIVLKLQNAKDRSKENESDNEIVDDDAIASSVVEAEISKLKVPNVIAETNEMKDRDVKYDFQLHPELPQVKKAPVTDSEEEYIEAPHLELKPINTSIGKAPSVLNPKLVKTNENNNITIVTPDVDNIQTNEVSKVSEESSQILPDTKDSVNKLTSSVLSNLDKPPVGTVVPAKPTKKISNVVEKPTDIPVNFKKTNTLDVVAKIPDPVDNTDFMELTPLQGQINQIKDVTGIQSNLTRSQRGVSNLEIKNTEPRKLIPTQNLMNVQPEKCNANTPKDCECSQIKQDGSDYNIQTENNVIGYTDNGYYNYQNI